MPHNDEEHGSATPLLASTRDEADQGWDREANKHNPRNWTPTFKWATVALVSFIEFMTTMPNFMYAPNITDAERELGTDNDTLGTLSLTIYVLGFGLGPLLFAPLSEMYGRAVIYRGCLFVFLIFTAGCAMSGNIEMLIAFRFLAGCLGAAPVAIGGAVVGDLFQVSERGTAMSVYQAGQIISAVVGPPIGGLVGRFLNWRWSFWIVCILSAVALICSFIVLRETHAPTLRSKLYGSPSEQNELAAELSNALSRPARMLSRSPVVGLSCVLIFMAIGILNVFLTEMSRIYQKIYHFSSAESGAVYLGLAIGFVLASVVFGSTNDRMMRAFAGKNNGKSEPEFRLPAAIAAMPAIVIGLLLYGWSLQFRKPWIIPTVGSGIAGLGITTVQLAVTTYLVDSFDTFSASALAAITLARSVGGAVVPLVGPFLYHETDQGWGNTIFAAVTLICSVIPIILFRCGMTWRARYPCDDL